MPARRLRVGRQQRHLLIEDALLRHRQDLEVAHVLERPAGVVVRRRILRRVVLDREVHVGQRAERLIAADDVVAGLDVDAAGLERRGGLRHLEPLAAQLVDRLRRVGLAALRRRNHPRVGRTGLALVHRALVLQPVVLEVELLVLRDVAEREQQRRLLDVGVVARAPLDRRQRRIRPEPLLARRRRAGRDGVGIGTVALHFVEAADRVVAVRDEEHVVRHPAVVEPVGPDAGHAALGHLHHVVLRQHPPLATRRSDRCRRCTGPVPVDE